MVTYLTLIALLVLEQANGEQAVRLNILEPLLGVTSDLLASTFSGFLRKRSYVLPMRRRPGTGVWTGAGARAAVGRRPGRWSVVVVVGRRVVQARRLVVVVVTVVVVVVGG